jgi:hypothetical protein
MFTHSLFGLACSVVVGLLTTTQFLLSASRPQLSRNILFPTHLFKNPLLFCVIFLGISTAPFLISLLSGEVVGQTYPDSEYNNLINLIGNTISSLALIALFVLLMKAPTLWAFIEEGYPLQDIIHTIFINLSVVSMVAFSLSEANRAVASYELYLLYSLVNTTWLILVMYLAISGSTYLILFVFASRKKARPKIFSSRDRLLVEPYLIYCFATGIMSTPGTFLFAFFTIACPITIIVVMELCELVGFDADGKQHKRILPFAPRTQFLLANLIVYSTIIAMKLEMYALFALLAPVGALLVVLFVIDILKGRKERHLLVRSIQALNNKERTSIWFDEKARTYHELREK